MTHNVTPYRLVNNMLTLVHSREHSPSCEDNASLSSQDIHCIFVSFLDLPSSTYLFTAGVEGFDFHLITLKHTSQFVRLLWTRDRPVAETSTWQQKHSQETNIHAPGGIRTQIPARARPQTYALDRAATGIGHCSLWNPNIHFCMCKSSLSHLIYLVYTLISSWPLGLDLQSSSCLQVFTPNSVCISLLPSACHMLRPSHPP
jgi:hypothetical protein